MVQKSTGIVIIIEPNHPTLLAAKGNEIAPIPIIDLIKLKKAYFSS